MRALAASIIAVSFAACGGGSKKTPDASQQSDAPNTVDADNTVCDPATVGTLDISSFDSQNMVGIWTAPLTGIGLGSGALDYDIQVYGGIESSLTGPFDLSMGNQANFSSCAICVVAFSQDTDANGNPNHAFFQKSGSITLAQDPTTTGHLMGTISNLKLQEVTINWPTPTNTNGDYTSTPVAGGACGSVASETIDHDAVPNAFTCTHTEWQDGTSCDCGCGVQDPDCFVGSNAITGCTGGQLCFNSTCQTAPANDTCQTAATLTLGTAVTGTTIGAPNNYDSGLEGATCTNAMQPGSDVAYKVALAAGTTYSVALTGLDPGFDGSVSLVGPGAATVCDASPITTCVAGADAGAEGADETFTYAVTTAGTYYVIVDSFYPPGEEAGAFTLTVTAM